MNQLLDIDELISENKKQESNRLDLFKTVLTQCHGLIKRHNKERIREMHYKIPAFIYGKPKYDIDVLRNYMVYHLEDNGLMVKIIDRYHLYVSWKESDIDLDKYMNRKSNIRNRYNNVYDNGLGPLSGPNQNIAMMKFRQERHKNLEESNRYALMKDRIDRQQKIQSERQQRFTMQKGSRNISNLDFKNYISKY